MEIRVVIRYLLFVKGPHSLPSPAKRDLTARKHWG